MLECPGLDIALQHQPLQQQGCQGGIVVGRGQEQLDIPIIRNCVVVRRSRRIRMSVVFLEFCRMFVCCWSALLSSQLLVVLLLDDDLLVVSSLFELFDEEVLPDVVVDVHSTLSWSDWTAFWRALR
jgi:hypothetical protein